MKNSTLILALIFGLAVSSCKKDPEPPGVIVSPDSFLHHLDLGDVIEFTIEGVAGDADLKSLEVTSKPEGGVTSTVLEEDLFGKQSSTMYVFDFADGVDEEVLLVFTITDNDGFSAQTARRIILNGGSILQESTGHNLYSNYSTGNTNGFNIADLEPLFLGSLADSLRVDLAQLDLTDDDVQDNVISSYSGIKFTRNNSFNYASATQGLASDSYESSVPLQTISNLEIDDILITRYDTLNTLHAAIKIIDIQDMPGSESDRIIFNIKK